MCVHNANAIYWKRAKIKEEVLTVVLDINILCNKMVENENVKTLLCNYGVCIESVISLANWMWEGEQKIELDQIEKEVDSNRIIAIQLKKPSIKDLGVYIEKCGEHYLYNLWINTAGHEMLDCNSVTIQNSSFYEMIYEAIAEIDNKDSGCIKIVGIGLETDFYFDKDIRSVMEKSRNIVSWIMRDRKTDSDLKKSYTEKSVGGLDMVILEKRC